MVLNVCYLGLTPEQTPEHETWHERPGGTPSAVGCDYSMTPFIQFVWELELVHLKENLETFYTYSEQYPYLLL